MTPNPLAGVYADLDRLLARQVSDGLLEQARRLLVDAHRVGHQQGMLDTIQRVADPADRDRLRSELLPSPRSPRRSPW